MYLLPNDWHHRREPKLLLWYVKRKSDCNTSKEQEKKMDPVTDAASVAQMNSNSDNNEKKWKKGKRVKVSAERERVEKKRMCHTPCTVITPNDCGGEGKQRMRW